MAIIHIPSIRSFSMDSRSVIAISAQLQDLSQLADDFINCRVRRSVACLVSDCRQTSWGVETISKSITYAYVLAELMLIDIVGRAHGEHSNQNMSSICNHDPPLNENGGQN